ncbi:arsenate reductase family protein [Rhodoblastus acidophilus]|uniref:Arsenate reductase family protein n=1 Tax=Candidatus Rhodoblastus alkanivorans TaxID=2954117 RepID=A0ABS9Z9V3_9HYPH|nr:ArsC/Spx/MgsR family protein [Candidatus Rhodoblastus alkanivorans]MCI4677121.1 arsenate reductase family protein [Candidatus Rhodoblastus alkanivorans]MCI4684474.1 arsenate reductase family protein [Candidatus Rhodoblastus alkanivorans]MDI4641795.1 arsenate reductase family protein [Rhodoblastus acidophilus]
MTRVIFYEKPGCGTNRKQKAMLAAAGHAVDERNLLTEPWTEERLLGFLGDMPVSAWFNPAAPRVKTGEIDPAAATAAEALALMIKEPLLIRRPLIEAGGQRCAGFDKEPVLSLLGQNEGLEAAQGCSRPAGPPCPAPGAKAQVE